MIYSEQVRQHFFNPYNLGVINEVTARKERAGSYALGAVVDIQLHADGNKILEARFKAFGNPYVIACASFACQWLENKSNEQIQKFNYQLLVEHLSIPQTKHYCAIIVEDAVNNALNFYQKNKREYDESYS